MKKRFSRFISILSKYEVYFFYSLALFSLLPIFLFDAFLTVDGPAHLYNSRLIIELLSDSSSSLSNFFEFNDLIITNWLGHFILSSLMLVFPALIAEKIFLSIYILLLPISFRYLAKTFELKESYALYFVFPFTYSFLFYYGFYNFHLGMVLLFISLALWIRLSKSSQTNPRSYLILVFLSVLIFFSHIFVFAILVAVISVLTLFKIVTAGYPKVKIFSTLGKTFLLLAPGLILLLIYLSSHELVPINDFSTANFSDSWSMVQNIEPARAVLYGKEGIFTKWIFILFVLITIYQLFVRIKDLKAPINKKSLIIGTLCIGLLVSFFVFPNGATFISQRLLLFFFLFFILFIASQKTPFWLRGVSFLLIVYVNLALLKIYTKATSESNSIINDIIAASENIEPYSTVLPIDDSDYWLLGHASNYLGISKPMVILENYEATTNYFPLVWNRDKLPFLLLGDTNNTQISFPHNTNNAKSQIDFVFIISKQNSEDNKEELEESVSNLLDQYYDMIYTNKANSIQLYKKS